MMEMQLSLYKKTYMRWWWGIYKGQGAEKSLKMEFWWAAKIEGKSSLKSMGENMYNIPNNSSMFKLSISMSVSANRLQFWPYLRGGVHLWDQFGGTYCPMNSSLILFATSTLKILTIVPSERLRQPRCLGLMPWWRKSNLILSCSQYLYLVSPTIPISGSGSWLTTKVFLSVPIMSKEWDACWSRRKVIGWLNSRLSSSKGPTKTATITKSHFLPSPWQSGWRVSLQET